jgi:hypothetical protein
MTEGTVPFIHTFAGKIIHPWTVICWACHKPLYYFGGNKRAFLKTLRQAGWDTPHGVWCCPQHKAEVEELGIEED